MYNKWKSWTHLQGAMLGSHCTGWPQCDYAHKQCNPSIAYLAHLVTCKYCSIISIPLGLRWDRAINNNGPQSDPHHSRESNYFIQQSKRVDDKPGAGQDWLGGEGRGRLTPWMIAILWLVWWLWGCLLCHSHHFQAWHAKCKDSMMCVLWVMFVCCVNAVVCVYGQS